MMFDKYTHVCGKCAMRVTVRKDIEEPRCSQCDSPLLSIDLDDNLVRELSTRGDPYHGMRTLH